MPINARVLLSSRISTRRRQYGWGITAVLLALTTNVAVAQAQNALGTASGYNLFTLGNATDTNIDVQGKIAVGGNAVLSSFQTATNITNTNPAADVLIVGGALSYNGGTANGNVKVGGAETGSFTLANGGTLSQNQGTNLPVNFSAEATNLKSLSNRLATYDSVATTITPNFNNLVFAATNSGINYFSISGANLAQGSSGLYFYTNGQSLSNVTFIVNVTGTSSFNFPNTSFFMNTVNTYNGLTFINDSTAGKNSSNNLNLASADGARQILYNVESGIAGFGATTIDGSVLAPLADFNAGQNGQLYGNFVFKTINQSSSASSEGHILNNGNFNGYFAGSVPSPAAPEAPSGTVAVLGIAMTVFGQIRSMRRRRIAVAQKTETSGVELP